MLRRPPCGVRAAKFCYAQRSSVNRAQDFQPGQESGKIDAGGQGGRQVRERPADIPTEKRTAAMHPGARSEIKNAKLLFWRCTGRNWISCGFRYRFTGSLQNSISELGARTNRGGREGPSQEFRLLQSQARLIRRVKQDGSRFLLRHRPGSHVVPESVQQILEIGNIHCLQTCSAKSLQCRHF